MTPRSVISNIVGNDTNVVIRGILQEIGKCGHMYESSVHSMNRGKRIQEVWNINLCLTEPRNRIFKSKMQILNPGLAATRFLYMISGSDLLEQIMFYTKSVRYFSDDGKTIPGSSYGARIFSKCSERNQFEAAAQIIMSRPDTKRALITIYNEADLARAENSLDIPCVANIVFMPRDNVLHMTVSMRANDAVKILPYNVFEFSLLQECMAARTGMELGSYWHTAVSMHIRGADILRAQDLVQEKVELCKMSMIPTFSELVRSKIMQEEISIRDVCTRSMQIVLGQMHRFWREYPAIWADILSTTLCEAFRLHNTQTKSTQEIVNEILTQYPRDAVLVGAYLDFLSIVDNK